MISVIVLNWWKYNWLFVFWDAIPENSQKFKHKKRRWVESFKFDIRAFIQINSQLSYGNKSAKDKKK